MEIKTSMPITKFRGSSRFEIELEFVQSLSNPWYLNHLASQKFLDQEEFLNYLNYLQYWNRPEYAQFLQYPGPTIRALQLLQQPNFRRAIMHPDFVIHLVGQGLEAISSFSREDPMYRTRNDGEIDTIGKRNNEGGEPSQEVELPRTAVGPNNNATEGQQPRVGLGIGAQ